ncbi:MAG: pitrilysin family protein [Bryobacteraceae bacterium]
MRSTSSKPVRKSVIRDIERQELPNGIRVVTERMPGVRSVSVGIWVGTGSREEAEHEAGISHFVEHMVFKGTKKRSAEQIARSVDSIGGGLDAFTSKEVVSFNVKVLDEHLPEAFDIVSDLVRYPLFDQKDLDKEKGVILEELKMEVDNPEYMAHELFSSHFWKGHGLGRAILGTRQTIRSFDRDKLDSYFREIYSPANLLVTAAGNLSHRHLAQLAEDHLGDLKPRKARKAGAVPQPHAPLVFKDRKTVEQVHLFVGVPSIAMPDESRFACYILNAILGGGMSSRLFQNIREKQGLAYSVYSELALYRDAGCMIIYAGTSMRTADRVIKSIMNEMHEAAATRVSDEELRRAKDHLKGSIVLGLESTSSRMANLARQETYFGRFMSMDEMLQRVEQVTAEEVQVLAQKFFQPKQIAVAMLGPLGGFKLRRQDLLVH